MGANVYITPDAVWDFFSNNKERLKKEMVVIAENDDTNYAVYLTEDCNLPLFLVCKGSEKPEYKEWADEEDCSEIARKFYSTYLFPVIVTNDKFTKEIDEPEEDLTRQEMEDAQYEREDELMLALGDFLSVVIQEGDDGTDVLDAYGQDFFDEILDHFLEYIAQECCIPVYRPMILTDEETGCEIYTEYPYNDEYEYPFEDDETVFQSGGWL